MMKKLKDLPVYSINKFEDYNNCQHCGNTFYIRTFNSHLQDNTFLDKPHGHDFFILLFITRGSGKHHIDFKSYDVAPLTIFFISPGQVHNWELSEDVDGYIIFFTKEYMMVDFNHNRLAKLPFFLNHMNVPFIALSKKDEMDILPIFRKIDHEYNHKRKFFHDLIRLNLQMLLIEIERKYNKTPLPNLMMYQENQIHKFTVLIDTHFREHKSVSIYADLMNISIKQLNTLCKKAYNKTSSDMIQERVLLEAKRLLIHSDFSIGTISEMLNYTDGSYFIRLFKKHTGLPPEQFRTHKKLE